MAEVPPPGREFFATRTVADAIAGFAPARRTAGELVPVLDALGRVPVTEVAATHPLPGFARSTVDGYAVRAADTFGVSESLPGYLEVVGTVGMGRAAAVDVPRGGAVAVPTGGALPAGADAVVMVEHTQVTLPGTVEVVRAVAPGDGIVAGDEDVASGAVLVPAGRPLRSQDLGLLAAAGVTALEVAMRPRVAIVSTGDEVVAPDTRVLQIGEVRDATTWALSGLVRTAGGEPVPCGIVPDDADELERVLRDALLEHDLVVVSAGSSVGARDETAGVVARLGEPGIFCHGLAVKPGKPTLLAECAGIPVIGLPGNPLSALVVFRLVGVPLVWRLAGCLEPPPEPRTRARLGRPVPSAAGRRDIVQVRLADGRAEPLFGRSALLSVLTAADGFITIEESSTGLAANSVVDVTLYR